MKSLNYLLDENNVNMPTIKSAIPVIGKGIVELEKEVNKFLNPNIFIEIFSTIEAKYSSLIERIYGEIEELFVSLVDGAYSEDELQILGARRSIIEYSKKIKQNKKTTLKDIVGIQANIEPKLPNLRQSDRDNIAIYSGGKIIYRPPESYLVSSLMKDLETEINTSFKIHPLIKMALLHHRFEAIHPFRDGNGRTGRVLNITSLIQDGVISSPIIFPSKQIYDRLPDYYRLLNEAPKENKWVEWTLYMIDTINLSIKDALQLTKNINKIFEHVKSQNVEENVIKVIFTYPYLNIPILQEGLKIDTETSIDVIHKLVEADILKKEYVESSNSTDSTFYKNHLLIDAIKFI